MKKILLLILCLVMMLSLFSCTDNPGHESDYQDDNKQNEDKDNENNTQDPEKGKDESSTEYPVITKVYQEWDTDGYHVYVSNNGNDSNDGRSKESAVKTVARADSIAQNYISELGTESSVNVIIAFESGTYSLSSSYTPVSGNDRVNVYYTSYGGQAYLTGGVQIEQSYIKKCTDNSVLSRISNDNVKNNLLEIDLSAYNSYLTELFASNYYGTEMTNYDTVEFYYGTKTLTPARWPNKGESISGYNSVTKETVSLDGYFITNYIGYYNSESIEKRILTPTEINQMGGDSKKTMPMAIALIDSVYDRVKNWDFQNEDIYVFDFFSNNWDDTIHKVIAFVSPSGGISMPNDVSYKGYFITDRGRDYNGELSAADGNGNGTYRRAYFFNILEEIDTEGEYYYDREGKKLYLYLGDDADTEKLYLSTVKDSNPNDYNFSNIPVGVINIKGTESNPIRNITFKNISFAYGQSDMVTISYAKNINIIDATISNCARRGVVIYRSTDISLTDSIIFDTGMRSVMIAYCNQPTPSQPLSDAKILIENCEMYNMGLRHISYETAVTTRYANGVKVRYCTLRDGGHAAIQHTGTTNLIVEYCEIFNFIKETDDVGVFYCYVQYASNFGTAFRYNYIHDIGDKWQQFGARVFYQDNDSLGYAAYGNVIENFFAGNDKVACYIFTGPKGSDIHDNLIMNIGGNHYTYYSYIDQYGSEFAKWWRWANYSEGSYQAMPGWSIYSLFQASGMITGKWDSDVCATDSDVNNVYKMMKYISSQQFLYDVYSLAAVQFSGASYQKWYNDGAMMMLDDNNISGFSIYNTPSSYTGKTSGFTSLDEFFDALIECGYDGSENPNVSIKYRYTQNQRPVTVQVRYIYYNIYSKSGDNYVFSNIAKRAAEVNSLQTGSALELSDFSAQATYKNMPDFYFSTDRIYTAKFYNNIVINMPVQKSKPKYNAMVEYSGIPEISERTDYTLFSEKGKLNQNLMFYIYQNVVEDNGYEFNLQIDLNADKRLTFNGKRIGVSYR